MTISRRDLAYMFLIAFGAGFLLACADSLTDLMANTFMLWMEGGL